MSKKHVAKNTSQVAATFYQRHQTHDIQHVVVVFGQQWNSLTQFSHLCRHHLMADKLISTARHETDPYNTTTRKHRQSYRDADPCLQRPQVAQRSISMQNTGHGH